MVKSIDKKLSPPSEEFESAVVSAGSVSVDCQLCGRYHFADAEGVIDEVYGEEGKFKKLLRESEENPEIVYHGDGDMVYWGTIDGKQAVIGCECNELSKYENFIWNNRDVISDYLSARSEEEMKKAETNKSIAEKVKNSI